MSNLTANDLAELDRLTLRRGSPSVGLAVERDARSPDPFGTPSSRLLSVWRSEPGTRALFAAYASALFSEMSHLHDDTAQAAVDILRRLALMAQGGMASSGGGEADTDQPLLVAQRFVRHNLHNQDLSVESVSRWMRISPRNLHRIFEPSGTTFSRFVTRERVEQTAAYLAKEPDGLVLDAAFAYGFSSSSVFYRAFHSHFGVTPTQYRDRFKVLN